MKKTTLIFLVLVVLAVLVGCNTVPYIYEYEEMKEVVEKIEIVMVNEVYPNYDVETLKVLTEEEEDELLLTLSKIEFDTHGVIGDLPDTFGICLKITYIDGWYELLCKGSTKYFTNNDQNTNTFWRYCSRSEFDDLISKFYES